MLSEKTWPNWKDGCAIDGVKQILGVRISVPSNVTVQICTIHWAALGRIVKSLKYSYLVWISYCFSGVVICIVSLFLVWTELKSVRRNASLIIQPCSSLQLLIYFFLPGLKINLLFPCRIHLLSLCYKFLLLSFCES